MLSHVAAMRDSDTKRYALSEYLKKGKGECLEIPITIARLFVDGADDCHILGAATTMGLHTAIDREAERHGMIIGVTGHQRIPDQALPVVRGGVRDHLRRIRAEHAGEPVTLISCLAVGADQLVAGFALEAGCRLHAMIPSDGYASTFDEAGLASYRELLGRADEITVLDNPHPCGAAYMKAGRRIVDDSDELIALWDGFPAAGLGGTGDVVAYAHSVGIPVRVIWPEGVRH